MSDKVLLQQRLRNITREIRDFRRALQSPKFTGIEEIKHPCKIHIAHGWREGCPDCSVRRERKDWISTADVERFLAGLQSLSQEE